MFGYTKCHAIAVLFLSLFLLLSSMGTEAETRSEELIHGNCKFRFEFPCSEVEPFFIHSKGITSFALNWRAWRNSYTLSKGELLCYNSVNVGNTTRNVLFQFDNFQSRFRIRSSGVIEKNGSSYGVTIDSCEQIPKIASPEKVVFIEFNFNFDKKSAEKILRKFPNAQLFSFSFLPDTYAVEYLLSAGKPLYFYWAFLHETLPVRLRREGAGIALQSGEELAKFFAGLLPAFLAENSLKWLEIDQGEKCNFEIIDGKGSNIIGLTIRGEIAPKYIRSIDSSFEKLSILHLPDCKTLHVIPRSNNLRHFSGCLSDQFRRKLEVSSNLISLQTDQRSAMRLGRIETLKYLHILGMLKTSESYDLSEYPILKFLVIGGWWGDLRIHPNPVPVTLDTVSCLGHLSAGKHLTKYIESNLRELEVGYFCGYKASSRKSGLKTSNLQILRVGCIGGTRTPVDTIDAIIALQPDGGYREVCITAHCRQAYNIEKLKRIEARSVFMFLGFSDFSDAEVSHRISIIDDSDCPSSSYVSLTEPVVEDLFFLWYRYLKTLSQVRKGEEG